MEQAGPDSDEFATALKQSRESAGLSRDELASAVGVSSSTIKGWSWAHAILPRS